MWQTETSKLVEVNTNLKSAVIRFHYTLHSKGFDVLKHQDHLAIYITYTLAISGRLNIKMSITCKLK